MTLPASTIALSQVQSEFQRGGANPISMSEYYKPGTYVLSTDTAPNVPASGTIKLSNFQNATANFSQTTYVYPAAFTDQGAPATWANTANALTVDGTFATGTANDANASPLAHATWNMTPVPVGATVNWVKLHLKGKVSGTGSSQTLNAILWNAAKTIGYSAVQANTNTNTDYVGSAITTLTRAQLATTLAAVDINWQTGFTALGSCDCVYLEVNYT